MTALASSGVAPARTARPKLVSASAQAAASAVSPNIHTGVGTPST